MGKLGRSRGETGHARRSVSRGIFSEIARRMRPCACRLLLTNRKSQIDIRKSDGKEYGSLLGCSCGLTSSNMTSATSKKEDKLPRIRLVLIAGPRHLLQSVASGFGDLVGYAISTIRTSVFPFRRNMRRQNQDLRHPAFLIFKMSFQHPL